MRSRRVVSGVALAALLLAATGPAAAACIPARQVFAVREADKTPFRQPSDLVLAGDRLLVLDDFDGRVAVLDLQGGGSSALSIPGLATGSWLGIGFGGADQIFLGSSGDGRVVAVDLKGRAVREFPVGEGDAAARPEGILISRTS